jgi:hypothetical protein
MKDDINLLPPLEIKGRRRRVFLQRFGRVLRASILAALLPNSVLASIYVFGLSERTVTPSGPVRETPAVDIGQEVVAANAFVGAVSNWVEKNKPRTPLVADIIRLAPTGIKLTEVGVDGVSGSFQVKGTGTSREAMVLYQRQLEQLPWVTKLEAPLSNFATGREAGFMFNIWP